MSTPADNPVLDVAARLLADLYDQPPALRPAPDAVAKTWARLEAAGLPRAGASEAHGGIALTAAELFALIRICGAQAVPAPLAESLLATWLWSRVPSSPAPADGIVTFAGSANGTLTLRRAGAGYAVEGPLARVPWAAAAHHVLAPALLGDQPVLVLAPLAGATITPGQNLAREPRDDLAITARPLEAAAVGALPAPSLRHVGALMRAAQISGAMATAIERSIAYANERVQFGRPIGKFQAVQQQLAEAAGHAAASAAAVDLAVALIDDAGTFPLAAAAAKARASEAAGEVAAICHQVHAAIAFTNEYPLQLATKRLWSWREEHGAETEWQRELGEHVIAAGASGAWPLVTTVSPRAT
jgi:alkylation response protein AidB-like acyl-CoA dehydrogenase